MTARAIRIIKRIPGLITIAVEVPEVRELNEFEIRGKNVSTVKNWISERRVNDANERSEARRQIFVWRKIDFSRKKKKRIAMRAPTE